MICLASSFAVKDARLAPRIIDEISRLYNFHYHILFAETKNLVEQGVHNSPTETHSFSISNEQPPSDSGQLSILNKDWRLLVLIQFLFLGSYVF